MNMEFITLKMNVKPKGIDIPQGIGQMGPKGYGIRRNALGEKFMEKLTEKELANTFTIGGNLIRVCLQEIKAGRGPIYEDLTHNPPEMYEDEKGRQAYEFLKTLGYDIKKEWVERQLPESHDFLGGLRINEKGETGIPGLYSAGESAGHAAGIVGAERRHGTAMMACWIFGRRAGRYAAERARKESYMAVDAKEAIERIREFKAGREINPEELEKEVRRFGSLLCGLRDETTLKKSIDAFIRIRNHEVPRAAVTNVEELVKVMEAHNLALSGEMVARAALMRTETRGHHLREDYPLINNKEWLKWILLKKEGEQMKLWTEPLPFHLYKLKPAV